MLRWNQGGRNVFSAASQRGGRVEFDAAVIAAAYRPGPTPTAGITTDADPDVAGLALQILEEHLAAGRLRISREAVRVCAACGHMTGATTEPCRACGHEATRPHTARLLIADRDPDRPALDLAHVHAYRRRAPMHLRNIAGNVPGQLILSRTRDHGISLSPLGLPGLILDPRVGLHLAALAVARQHQAGTVVMLLTENAAANIAAYGQPFLQYEETRLLYGLHGKIPYDALPSLQHAYERHHFNAATRTLFETWLLPLYSWKEKRGIHPNQLPNLLKHFHRARLSARTPPDGQALQHLRTAIQAGAPGWLTTRSQLANALSARTATGGPPG